MSNEINKELVSETFQEVVCNYNFTVLNTKEKLTLATNLILFTLTDLLPNELDKDKISILNNGKEIALLLNKYKNNTVLQIALKTHLILDLANKHL